MFSMNKNMQAIPTYCRRIMAVPLVAIKLWIPPACTGVITADRYTRGSFTGRYKYAVKGAPVGRGLYYLYVLRPTWWINSDTFIWHVSHKGLVAKVKTRITT